MIIFDLPFDEYLKRPELSNSGIGKILKSPAHFKGSEDVKTKSTDTGSLLHKLVLEPDGFDAEYHVADVDRRTKEGKAVAADVDKAGKKLVSTADYDAARAMRDAIMSHPVAGELFSIPGDSEVTMTGQISGVGIKGRADRLTKDRSMLIDLKTTSDASPEATQRSVITYGYHRQDALYTYLLSENGHLASFIFAAVETANPYVVTVYELEDELVNRGMDKVLDGIERYKRCVEAGRWPGYSDHVMRIAAPSWMR